MLGAADSARDEVHSSAMRRWGRIFGVVAGGALGVLAVPVLVSQTSLSGEALTETARGVGWGALVLAAGLAGRWAQGRRAHRVAQTEGAAAVATAPSGSLPRRARAWSVDVLQQLDRARFQALCCAFFRESGVAATTHAGDEDSSAGDIRLHQDPRRPGAVTAVVRCVPWGPTIDVWAVRALAETRRRESADRAFFMAPGGFAPDALAFAAQGRMTLFDSRLMLALIRRLPEDSQQRLLDLAATGDWTAPACPECGERMVVRNVIRRPFWGCSRFPQCRGTLPMNRKAGLQGDDGPLAMAG